MYTPKLQHTTVIRYRAKDGRFRLSVIYRHEHLEMNTDKPLKDAPWLIRKTMQYFNAQAA